MTQDTFKTPVVFRKCTRPEWGGEITAVFPATYGSSSDTLDCYAHIGQHGGCCVEWVRDSTVPAQPEEYADLLAELIRIGYDPEVVQWRGRAGLTERERD